MVFLIVLISIEVDIELCYDGSMEEEQINPFKRLEMMQEEIERMMLRWKAGSVIKHIDLDLFDRLVHERFLLERQLMIAMETIEVLSNKANQNEIVLKHFNDEDLQFLRRRIRQRKEREAEEATRLESDPEQSI